VVSKVLVQRQNKAEIRSRLASSGRFDLQAPVEYLLNLPSNEVNFYFSPAGKHQLRDTSTFPVPAIETFPAWLREALFGPGIDIEAAYTQFLIEHLREAYAGREGALKLLYPDLLRSLQEKQVWRRELCELLGLEETEESTALVKRLIMSLANGSRISPALLLGTSGYSSTRDTVLEAVTDTSVENLTKIGERLCSISRQYSTARKHVCTLELRLHPSRANQKKVFLTYFQWEREARYRIWEAVDRHGIMVHDGIDGIPARYLTDIPGLVKSLNLRLT
jgi:hypothetical protein